MSTARTKNRQDIIKAVDQLLVKNKIDSAPIPVEKVAKNLGLKIQFESYDEDMSGCLVRDGEDALIGVNISHHKNRQRFTVAHEIGHFLFHPGESIFVDRVFRVNRRDHNSSTAEKPEEIEANQFASELLMPTELLLEDLNKYISKNPDVGEDDLIEHFAHKYQVSVQAMVYKLVNIKFLP